MEHGFGYRTRGEVVDAQSGIARLAVVHTGLVHFACRSASALAAHLHVDRSAVHLDRSAGMEPIFLDGSQSLA